MTFEQQVSKLYNEGKSTYEIAESLQTYPNKVLRSLKKQGIAPRSKSDAQRLALSSGRTDHPTEGKKRSYEDKLKISASLTEYWENMPESERQEKVDQAKERWSNMSSTQRQHIYDLAIQAIKKAGKEGSKFERFLYEKLLPAFTVDFHKKDLIPNQNLEIDLYIPRLRTIIEIDGPSHFLPVWGDEKLQRQIAADLDKNGLILSKGFAIIRLKVLKSLSLASMEAAAETVLGLLRGIENQFPPLSKRYIEVDL